MFPLIGSGKYITAPVITENGDPIRDPLVILETNMGNGDAAHTTASGGSRARILEMEKETDKKIIRWKLTLHQIGLDVKCTDRILVFYEKNENLAKLWDILPIYSWIDEDVGYCQDDDDVMDVDETVSEKKSKKKKSNGDANDDGEATTAANGEAAKSEKKKKKKDKNKQEEDEEAPDELKSEKKKKKDKRKLEEEAEWAGDEDGGSKKKKKNNKDAEQPDAAEDGEGTKKKKKKKYKGDE